MAAAGEVTLNLKPLQALRKEMAVAARRRVDVGIFQENNSRDDGETNASIGAKMEFGSSEESTASDAQLSARGREWSPLWSGNPARSFLFMPLFSKLRGQLEQHAAYIFSDVGHEGGFTKALERIGFYGQYVVQEAFYTQGYGTWDPNTPTTVAWKGSNRPLLDSHQLVNSISYRVVMSGSGNGGDPF